MASSRHDAPTFLDRVMRPGGPLRRTSCERVRVVVGADGKISQVKWKQKACWIAATLYRAGGHLLVHCAYVRSGAGCHSPLYVGPPSYAYECLVVLHVA